MHDTLESNFTLKGLTSILIGLYFFIAASIINSIIKGFLIDDNPLGMLSPQIIEIVIFTLIFFVFLFSSLALFFGGKRTAKKFDYKLWNTETKIAFRKYILKIVVIILALILLVNLGYINYLTPVFLTLYGVLLAISSKKQRKNLLVLSGISVLLAGVCFLIPSYWHASLSIIGIAHIAYGVTVRY